MPPDVPAADERNSFDSRVVTPVGKQAKIALSRYVQIASRSRRAVERRRGV